MTILEKLERLGRFYHKGGHPVDVLANPDGPEASSLIRELAQALRYARTEWDYSHELSSTALQMMNEALAKVTANPLGVETGTQTPVSPSH